MRTRLPKFFRGATAKLWCQHLEQQCGWPHPKAAALAAFLVGDTRDPPTWRFLVTGPDEWACGHVAGSMCAECFRELAERAHQLAERLEEET
jgi:hypothetical protein